MVLSYKPDKTFSWTAGQHTSGHIFQDARHGLIGVMSEAGFRGLGTSPAGEFYVQFLGSFTADGTYAPIKNSDGIVHIVVQAGKNFCHPLDPADFAAFPFVKAQVVGVLGGSGIPQLTAKTMSGKLYEV